MKLLVPLVLALVCTVSGASASSTVPDSDHVIVVVFENKESNRVLGSRDAPTFNLYSRVYARATRYYGVTHPSLPNYLAMVAGSTFGHTINCDECPVAATSLADTIEDTGRTWKTYAEGLPVRGFLGGVSGRYAKKHNPFAYFTPVIDDPKRAQRIVPLRELATDVARRQLPDFAFVVPDLCHSMHDCPVGVGDAWLRRTVGPLLKLPRTAIFITFDEGNTDARGGGHIPMLIVGTAVQRKAAFRRVTNHYGLLRTIEDGWRLPRLGLSARARPITGIWR
jgi:phosphatidylinositol-3-phosphatase